MAETLDEVVAAFNRDARSRREARPATLAVDSVLKHAIVVLESASHSPGCSVWLESGWPPKRFAGRCWLPNIEQGRIFAQNLSVVTGIPVEDRTQEGD